MKAISPSMPTPVASRHDRSAEISAVDEVFGALMTAALGATPLIDPSPPATRRPEPETRAVSGASRRANAGGATGIEKRATDKADASKPDDAAPSGDGGGVRASDRTNAAPETSLAADTSSDPASGSTNASPKPVTEPTVPGTVTARAAANGLEAAAAVLAKALAEAAPTHRVAGNSVSAKAKTAASPRLPGGAQQLPTRAPGQLAATPEALPPLPAPAHHAASIHKVPSVPASVAAAALAGNGQTQVPPTGLAPAGAGPGPGGEPAHLLAQFSTQAGAGGVAAPATHVDPHRAGAGGQPGPGTSAAPDIALAAAANAPALTVTVPTAPPTVLPNAAPAAVPAPVAEQIVRVLTPLHESNDGSYTLSLQLHPAELGPVTIRVDVSQGVLSVHLLADHLQGHEALNQSLHALRAQLEASGVQTGDIQLGTAPSLMHQHDRQQQQAASHQPAPRQLPETSGHQDAGTTRRPPDSRNTEGTDAVGDAVLDVRI